MIAERPEYDKLVARRLSPDLTRGKPSSALPPVGATHPYGKDPRDAMIRLAPTFPVLQDVEWAMEGVVVCPRLALASRGT